MVLYILPKLPLVIMFSHLFYIKGHTGKCPVYDCHDSSQASTLGTVSSCIFLIKWVMQGFLCLLLYLLVSFLVPSTVVFNLPNL